MTRKWFLWRHRRCAKDVVNMSDWHTVGLMCRVHGKIWSL